VINGGNFSQRAYMSLCRLWQRTWTSWATPQTCSSSSEAHANVSPIAAETELPSGNAATACLYAGLLRAVCLPLIGDQVASHNTAECIIRRTAVGEWVHS
jgi:hypothetical protein